MLRNRREIYLQVGGLVAIVVVLASLAYFFPIVDLVVGAQKQVLQWGAWSAVCYPLLFAMCNLLLLPGGILTVGGGFFFGLWWGFAIVVAGNALGAAAAFGLSRWFAHGWLGRKLLRTRTLRALEPAVEREGWKIIVLSQLHPLFPTSLINYIYGLTRVRFRTYMFWASIGRAPGLFLYAYLGTLGQYGLNVVQGRTHPRVIEYWIWGGAFVVTALLFLVLSRVAVRTMRRLETLESRDREWSSRSTARLTSTP